MGTLLTVKEALRFLEKYSITSSEQVLTRWLRAKRIPGIQPNKRKDGWKIKYDDLLLFIDQEKPGLREVFARKDYLEDALKQVPGRVEQLERVGAHLPVVDQIGEENEDVLDRNINMRQLHREVTKAIRDVKQDIEFFYQMFEELETRIGEQMQEIQQVRSESAFVMTLCEQMWGEYEQLHDFVKGMSTQSIKLEEGTPTSSEIVTASLEQAQAPATTAKVEMSEGKGSRETELKTFKTQKVKSKYRSPKRKLDLSQFEEFLVNMIKVLEQRAECQDFIITNMGELHSSLCKEVFAGDNNIKKEYCKEVEQLDKKTKELKLVPKYACPFTKKLFSYQGRFYRSVFMHQLNELRVKQGKDMICMPREFKGI